MSNENVVVIDKIDERRKDWLHQMMVNFKQNSNIVHSYTGKFFKSNKLQAEVIPETAIADLAFFGR